LLKISARLKKTNSIEWKTVAERPQTARSEQNYKHVTELIYRQEGNTRPSRSPREMRNLSSGTRSSHGHKHIITNVFSHCVKMHLGCFNYIIILMCKILTQLSGFGFILYKKKQRLKCCIVCTAKHVQVQYKQHNLRGRFFMAIICVHAPVQTILLQSGLTN